MVRVIVLLLFLITAHPLRAQTGNNDFDKLMEQFAEYTSSSADFLDLYDQVVAYQSNPININKANFQELSVFPLIGEARALALLAHRQDFGDYISFYELQSVDGFPPGYIKLILPYISIGNESLQGFRQSLKEGKHELMVLSQYSDIESMQPINPTDSNRILGDGYRALLRYRYAFPGKYSFGITAEKDAGELWPVTENGRRAAYFSMHFFVQPQNRWIETLAIGDYQLNFGQGLTFSSGLSFGKSALVLNSFRAREGIRPYRSVNETQFLRGIATKINLSAKSALTVFVSRNRETVTINNQGEAGTINTFGFVRTLRDLERNNNQEVEIYGFNFTQRIRFLKIGITAVNQNFSVPFAPLSRPYAVHRLQGNELSNFGFDYKGNLKNMLLFGEVSTNGLGQKPSMIHGLLIALSEHWSANLVYRNYQKDYKTIFSTAWGEQTSPVNEKAGYLSIQYEKYRKYKVAAFADIISFPWLRFRDNAPGFQNDFFIEALQYFNKYTTHYIRLRNTVFSDNYTSNALLNQQQNNNRWNIRYHFDKDEPGKIATAFRAEIVALNNQEKKVLGSLFFADLGYNFTKSKIKVSARYTLFNTPDFDSRIYAFERDVLYAFSIPAMYGNGSRVYAVITAKPFRKFTFWMKLTVERNDRTTTIDQVNFSPLGRVQIRYTW